MNPGDPIISVIMPVYNPGRHLDIAVRSILDQDFTDFELIIIDDGSTDGALAGLNLLGDPRVKLLSNEGNRGIVYTRNRGVHAARGKYIAILDSDDIACKDRFSRQVEFMEKHPDVGICGSDYDVIDENGGRLVYRIVPDIDKKIRTHLLFQNCILNSSVMVRREMLFSHPYSEDFSLGEDYFLWFHLSKITRLHSIRRGLTQYRVHMGNISVGSRGKMLDFKKKIERIMLEDLGLAYSEAEFEAHHRFLNTTYEEMPSSHELRLLESWLRKLCSVVRDRRDIDQAEFRRIMTKRWLHLYFQHRRVTTRVFSNALFGQFPVSYVRYWMEYSIEKFTKRQHQF